MKEPAFDPALVQGLGALVPRLRNPAASSVAVPQFSEKHWAWRVPMYANASLPVVSPSTHVVTDGPPSGGHWVSSRLPTTEPTASNPGGYWWYWYPWPVGMSVGGRGVYPSQRTTGYVETMPGYWVDMSVAGRPPGR